MRSLLKALLVTGSLVAASLGTAGSAAAASSPPTLDTSHFACSNGVCEVGPGNVGMSFAAGLFVIPSIPQECVPYIVTVSSGSLPPGLQLANVSCAWTITGTPTQAGTYAFTVQMTSNTYNPPPSGFQQLTITIGTGTSDRPAEISAGWSIHTHEFGISGWDVNTSALWSASVTSTGRVIFSNLPSRVTYPIDGFLIVQIGTGAPCGTSSCQITVTNSLGSSITVTMPSPF